MKTVFGPYHGVVDRVVDGDTVYIKLDVGFDLTVYTRVRVWGINAPELSTDAGKAAHEFAARVLPVGLPVYVLSHGWDKYGGRIDGEIGLSPLYWYDGAGYSDFGNLMVATGNAVPYQT